MRIWLSAVVALIIAAIVPPSFAQQEPATIAQLLAVCRDQSAEACKAPILDAAMGADIAGCTLPDAESVVSQVVAWLAQHPAEQTKTKQAGVSDAFKALYDCDA